MAIDKTPDHIRLDEKNHVEEPFLKQLESMPGIHWDVLRLEMGQGQTHNKPNVRILHRLSCGKI